MFRIKTTRSVTAWSRPKKDWYRVGTKGFYGLHLHAFGRFITVGPQMDEDEFFGESYTPPFTPDGGWGIRDGDGNRFQQGQAHALVLRLVHGAETSQDIINWYGPGR